MRKIIVCFIVLLAASLASSGAPPDRLPSLVAPAEARLTTIGLGGGVPVAAPAGPDLLDEKFDGDKLCYSDPVGSVSVCSATDAWYNPQKSGSNTYTFDSTEQYYGASGNSLKLYNPSYGSCGYIYHDFGVRTSTTYYRSRFYVSSYTGTGTNSVFLMGVFAISPTSGQAFGIYCLYYDATNVTVYVRGYGGDITSLGNVTIGAWHTLKVKFNHGTDAHEGKVDSGSAVAFGTASVAANQRYIYVGNGAVNETASTTFHDDIAVSTTAAGIDY